MNKKIVSVLLCVALATTMLAGCSNNQTAETNKPEANEVETNEVETNETEEAEAKQTEANSELKFDDVKLSIMMETGTDLTAFYPVADLIKEKLGIELEVEFRPAGSEGTNLIRTRLASGDMSDLLVYNVGSLTAALNPKENFIDMTDSDLAATVDASFTSAASVDGRLYAVPSGSSSGGGVMYNKDVYEKYDLEVPKTWSEFIANMDILKEAGEVALIGSFADPWTAQVPFLADNYQVMHNDPNFATEFTAGEKKFADSVAFRSWEKLEATQPYYNDDMMSITYDVACDMLAMGEGAHYIMTTGILQNIYTLYGLETVNKIGVFPVPGDTEEETGLTVWCAGGLYGNKESANVDAVRAVMDFWNTDEALDIAVEHASPSGPFHNGYKLPDDVFDGVKDQVAYFDAGRTAPALEFLTPVKGANCDAISAELVTGQTTAKEAAEAYDQDCIKMAVQLGLDWN